MIAYSQRRESAQSLASTPSAIPYACPPDKFSRETQARNSTANYTDTEPNSREPNHTKMTGVMSNSN